MRENLIEVATILIAALQIIIPASLQTPNIGLVSVKGNVIFRDGHPWVARGLSIIGRTAPAMIPAGGFYKDARKAFGSDELLQAKHFGADLIRFQVSQGGLDPESSIYEPHYAAEIGTAVLLARMMDFSVIVCIDSQPPSGLNNTGMPSDKTARAWKTLAPLFADDKGVMYELFNEPAPTGPDTAVPYNWDTWKRQFQPIVDEIRGMGASNVILLDGLDWGRRLSNAPEIADPIAQLIYATHPYYAVNLETEAGRNATFGDFAATHPVMASEWGATTSAGQSCVRSMPAFAEDMLNYLDRRKIGVVAWAFDYPGTLKLAHSSKLTSFLGFSCSVQNQFGPGMLIAQRFQKR